MISIDYTKLLIVRRLQSGYSRSNRRIFSIIFQKYNITDQAEIDYIEETDGVLHAFEFKWKKQNVTFSKSFLDAYPDHQTTVVTRADFEEFVGLSSPS